MKNDLSLSITSLPLIFTVLLPFFISFEKDVLGYGTGTGPAGGEGGLRQTSGKAAMTFPSPDLHEISMPFAKTSLLMHYVSSIVDWFDASSATARLPESALVKHIAILPGA